MPKRGTEPDEALGPQIDGLSGLENLDTENLSLPGADSLLLPDLPLDDEAFEPVPVPEEPVALIFGNTADARATAALAAQCGFAIEVALDAEPVEGEADFPDARKIHFTPDYLDIVDICGIDRDFYVCVFVPEIADCEIILSQCLASPASYLGVDLAREQRETLYTMLKEDGAPDAELAAVCCPAGLAIGADTPEETAVAIAAEMLAARAGTLKRLRYDD